MVRLPHVLGKQLVAAAGAAVATWTTRNVRVERSSSRACAAMAAIGQ